jgi:hypothetical protein
MKQEYTCPNCGYSVGIAIRFCRNCGIALNWLMPISNQYQSGLQQKKKGLGLLSIIGLMAIGILIGVLITHGIIISDPSLQAPVSTATSVPQSLSQTLPLSAPTLSFPGQNTDPGQTIDTIAPAFQWNKVSGADYYSLVVSKFPYNDSIIYTPTQPAGTSFILPNNKLEYGQRYRWTVKAHDNSGSSSISNALYFLTPPPLPQSDPTSTSVPTVSQPYSIPIYPPASASPWAPVTLPGWAPI